MDTSSTNDNSYIFDIWTIEEFSWFVEEQRLYIPLISPVDSCRSFFFFFDSFVYMLTRMYLRSFVFFFFFGIVGSGTITAVSVLTTNVLSWTREFCQLTM